MAVDMAIGKGEGEIPGADSSMCKWRRTRTGTRKESE
jgi:hypothetical protein